MKISSNSQLTIKLKGKNADRFVAAIKKMAEEDKQIGIKRSILDEDELKVIKKLADKITIDE